MPTWKSKLLLVGVIISITGLFHIAHGYDIPIVIISEIMWAKAEYIELQNTTDADISLDGWSITRQKTAGDSEDTEVTFNASDSIPAHGFFLIESSEDATSVPSNKIKSVLGLVDTGALVRIKDKTGTAIDSANQYGSWFKGENNTVGYSMERVNPVSSCEEASSWQTSTGNVGGRVGTPGEENSTVLVPTPTPTPTPSPDASPTPLPDYSNAVYINEYMPNPTGDDTKLEFIELYNSSSDAIDISGWKLDDAEGTGSSPFIIPEGTKISGNDFIVFYSSQTKISLNNDSDHVRLLHPDDTVSSDEEYTSSKEGYSYNRTDNGDFQLSFRSTPGEVNIIETPTPTPTPTPKITPSPTPKTYQFSTKIVINEVYPSPSKPDQLNEFIEIKNNDNRSLSLYGWMIDDADGGSKPYHFKDTDSIAKNSIIAIYKADSKIALNNDKDTARLIDPNGKVIAAVAYDHVKKGQSYNRSSDGIYVWSDVITPSKENIIFVQQTPQPTKKPVSKKKTKPAVSRPRVAGISTATATSIIPLPSASSEVVVKTIVGNTAPGNTLNTKQAFFVLFGLLCGAGQLASGVAQKEKIWFWGK
ncbi:MAG TPA: lamin tail domain-containing protein [Candidatus Andersenbacteria bacterium]|nr:lamin tail domain-containing protein [Candidatus Andersenbacteria bacterium]